MLCSFVVHLEALDDISLNGYGGEAIHGLFYEVLRTYSPKVADAVHNGAGRIKPFTLSGVIGKKEMTSGRLGINEGDRASFRLTVLDEELIPDILASFSRAVNLGTAFQLSGSGIRISTVEFQGDGNPLVRTTLYSAISSQAKPQTRRRLVFMSPTSFRSKGRQVILPDPSLVFRSVAEKWNAFSGDPVEEELMDSLGDISPSEFRIQSELVHFSNYKVVGFKGSVEFRLGSNFSREQKKRLSALCDYAFFSGVGYKTTMGMGQVMIKRSLTTE